MSISAPDLSVTIEPGVPCLLCGDEAVAVLLDLGETALANKFLSPEDAGAPDPGYPLVLGRCRTCGHVQLTERVPPPAMFEDYLYVSGVSETLSRHLHSLADAVTAWIKPTANDLAVDVGCNDGTLLTGFRRNGMRVLGVDPARNLAPLAAARGVPVETAFFSAATARSIAERHGPARVITATNVFPHIPALDDFMAGVDALLAPDGVLAIEAHYLLDMYAEGAFDTIYHEHVSYWSLTAMRRLFARHGMEVTHAARMPIHHGQLRVFVQRVGVRTPEPGVAALSAAEQADGALSEAAGLAFAAAARRTRSDLRERLAAIRRDGGRVAAYGAPAKGSTLLSFLDLGPADIDFIADKSPLKQGRLTPGSRIPVVSPERILTDMPDCLVLLAWNFKDEILEQQAEYRRRGGRFLLPLPEVIFID